MVSDHSNNTDKNAAQTHPLRTAQNWESKYQKFPNQSIFYLTNFSKSSVERSESVFGYHNYFACRQEIEHPIF